MRRLSLALALSFVAPAGAEALDCGGMKSSAQPFELTIDSTGKSVGKDPVAMPMRRQVIRKIDETVVFDIFSPSRVLRRTFAANGLLTEVIGADDKTPRVASYSIDMAKDYFALGKPFDFNVVMKNSRRPSEFRGEHVGFVRRRGRDGTRRMRLSADENR